MKKTFTCRTVVDITVNIDKCVEDFADGNFATIEEYVEDFWCGLDDCFYYCDNAAEIQTEICRLMRQAMADGNK